jgi:hypothetical protein
LHEAGNVGRTQRGEADRSSAETLREELPYNRQVVLDRRPGEPALTDQVALERLRDVLKRAPGRNRGLRRGDPLGAEKLEDLPQGRRLALTEWPTTLPGPDIPREAVRRERRRRLALTFQPARQGGGSADLDRDVVLAIPLCLEQSHQRINVSAQRPLVQSLPNLGVDGIPDAHVSSSLFDTKIAGGDIGLCRADNSKMGHHCICGVSTRHDPELGMTAIMPRPA